MAFRPAEIVLKDNLSLVIYYDDQEQDDEMIRAGAMNWMVRADEYTEESLCCYMFSKGFDVLTSSAFQRYQ